MADDVKLFLRNTSGIMGQLTAQAPDMLKGSTPFLQVVMKDGAISLKAQGADCAGAGRGPCAARRASTCTCEKMPRRRRDARAEIIEAATVAVVMQGGPSFTYMPYVLDALEALGK
jgi:alkylhydroperoxidase/carboxymuconolactone decarboxylase family protein YurZ